MKVDTLFQCVTAIFATASLIHSLISINRMSRYTHHGVRASYCLVACGALWEILSIVHGRTPDVGECLFFSGVGMLTIFGRREQFTCPYAEEAKPKVAHGRRVRDFKQVGG